MPLDLQLIITKVVMFFLGTQALGGVVLFTCWVVSKALNQFVRTVGCSAAFVNFVFAEHTKRWWGKWM